MPWRVRIVLGLVVCSACAPAVAGREPPATPKARVEFRWVEDRRIEGVTEDKGFQMTCDPKSVGYAHTKPALVLTAADVIEAPLSTHDFRGSGSGVVYSVTLHLTKEARKKLAEACGMERERALTVVVDGNRWGVHRYDNGEHNSAQVPAQARAATFLPSVGFFSSKAEAERLADAFK